MTYFLCLWFSLGCSMDETLTGYVPPSTFLLVEVDGLTTQIEASLKIEANGDVSGQAPCNRYFTSTGVPYPWVEFQPVAFGARPIGMTRRACPDLPAENAYFEALSAMQLAEILGDILILNNEDGRSMVFQRQD